MPQAHLLDSPQTEKVKPCDKLQTTRKAILHMISLLTGQQQVDTVCLRATIHDAGDTTSATVASAVPPASKI